MTYCRMILVLLMLLQPGYTNGESIVIPPVNVTSTFGGTATFRCQVDYGLSPRTMTWEFDERIVYSFLAGFEDYPMKLENKYHVLKNGNTFTLTLNNLVYQDGGMYKCVAYRQQATAVLVVIGEPILISSAKDLVEGDTVAYSCEAPFGGPSKKHISSDHYPKLRMFFDGDYSVGLFKDTESNCQKADYHLCKVYHMTVVVDASMHGTELKCVFGTSSPVLRTTSSNVLNVYYSVRNTGYTPHLEKYEVGKQVSCSAAGNPPPYFEWTNLANLARSTKSKWLNITVDLAGSNQWRCTARNTIQGDIYEDSITASFDAVLDGSDHAIGASVYLIVFGIVFGLVLLGVAGFLFWRKKYRSSRNETSSYTHNLEDQNGRPNVPLLHIPTQGSIQSSPESLRVLLFKSEYISDSQDSVYEWSEELIFKIENLVKNEDPTWIANDQFTTESHQSTAQLQFFWAIFYILLKKNHLFPSIMKVTPLFLSEERVIEDNLGCTVLHALVEFNWSLLTKHSQSVPTNFFEQYKSIISEVKKFHPSLVDKTDSFGKTPLHVYVEGIRLHEDMWKGAHDICLLLKSQNNADAKDLRGRGVLHHLVEAFPILKTTVSQTGHDAFIELVQNLKSESNVNFKDYNDCTALHILAEKYNAEFPEHCYAAYLDLVRALACDSNVNIQDSQGCTALHILATAFGPTLSNNGQKTFIEVMEHLSLKTDTNIKNHQGNTVKDIITSKYGSGTPEHCQTEFHELFKIFSIESNTDI